MKIALLFPVCNSHDNYGIFDNSKLLPMNKDMAEIYYVENCLKENTLCNNKCRCGNKEEIKVFSGTSDFGGSTTSSAIPDGNTTDGASGVDVDGSTGDEEGSSNIGSTGGEEGSSNIGLVSHDVYHSKCINSQCVKVDNPTSLDPVEKSPSNSILKPIKKKILSLYNKTSI